jgi:hypothetical protein
MIRMPTDADGLVLPRVDPEAAWDAATGLTSVASTAQAAADALSGAPASATCWSGDAADAYRRVRERMARRTVELAEVASAAAGAVLAWMRAAAPALDAMRSAANRVREAQRRVEVAAAGAYDVGGDTRLQAELDAAYAQWHVARDAYWQATDTAARRFVALRDGVTDHPLDLRDHSEAALRTAWDGYVAGPATAAWALTGQVVTDPGSWWQDVRSLPDDVVRSIAAAATAPAGTAGGLVDADAWADGRYGEGLAAAAVTFLPGPRWLAVGKDLGPVRFAHNLADPNVPVPTVQTIDEMLEGVDLDRHEHATLGHALRRHVDVDDDYLMDRLTHGTLLDEGDRGWIPPKASRFGDRLSAERIITDVLRVHELDLRAFDDAPLGERLRIEYSSADSLGEVMRRAPGGFTIDSGNDLVLVLAKGPDGPFIETAYVE